MTNPNTGSTPYGQDPNSYTPQTGSQQAYPQTGSQAYPQTGRHDATAQYGQQQYDQQYGQQPYGQQQYGQQGMAPMPAYGGAPHQGTQRPGLATAAGVIGIIFGTIGFFYSAYVLISLTAVSEIGMFGQSDGFVMVLAFISTIGIVIAAVMVFIGAIQLLGGKSNQLIFLACVVYIVAQIIGLIGVMIGTEGEGVATLLVGLVISLILAGMLMYFSKNKDVNQWLARKKAAEAAGYNG